MVTLYMFEVGSKQLVSPGCGGAPDAVRGCDALWHSGHVEEAALPAPELGHSPVGPRIGHLSVQAPEMQVSYQLQLLSLRLRRLAMELESLHESFPTCEHFLHGSSFGTLQPR